MRIADDLKFAASRLEECSRRASENADFAIKEGYPNDSLAGDERSEIWMADMYRTEARKCEELRCTLLLLAEWFESGKKFV